MNKTTLSPPCEEYPPTTTIGQVPLQLIYYKTSRIIPRGWTFDISQMQRVVPECWIMVARYPTKRPNAPPAFSIQFNPDQTLIHLLRRIWHETEEAIAQLRAEEQ